MTDDIRLSIIVARGRNGVIGVDGDLPWRLSEDLKFFKRTTLGKPILMGRATWESFPRRPLPGRDNIVVSRDWAYAAPGARVYSNLSTAIQVAKTIAAQQGGDEVFIIGGGMIYEKTLPLVDRLYLTDVDAAPQGQVYFPKFDQNVWKIISSESYKANEKNDHDFTWQVLDRKRR